MEGLETAQIDTVLKSSSSNLLILWFNLGFDTQILQIVLQKNRSPVDIMIRPTRSAVDPPIDIRYP